MNSPRKHLSYANVVATLALVLATGGSAVAANHYLINSAKQINPKVLKKLKGNAGHSGLNGVAGARGLDGPQGPAGTEGKEGPRGPSDVYEVVLGKAKEAATPGGVLILTLPNLPAGTYAIFGKASLEPLENVASPVRCELLAEGDEDLTIFNWATTAFGEKAVPITTELTHTFASTGEAAMRCRFETGVKWGLTTRPDTRIVAIRVGSQYASTAEAE
jgi:hypothetical protein